MTLAEIQKSLKVPANTIESWLKKGDLEDGRKRSGVKPSFQYILYKLFEYFTEQRKIGFVMNEKVMMKKVAEICNEIKAESGLQRDPVLLFYEVNGQTKEDLIKIDKLEEFAFSHGWFINWSEEFKVTNRRGTHIAQASPFDKMDIAKELIDALKAKRRLNEYDISMIINFDETPVYFDMIGNTTLNIKGHKTIFIKNTNSQKKRITAGLCIAASGHILKPIIIYKGKNKGIIKGITNKKGYILKKNENSWMTKELFLHYIHIELKDYLNAQRKTLINPAAKGLFVFDCFSGHIDEKIFNELKKINCDWAVIPPGCTSLVQPLDVSVNRSFKTKLKSSWSNWFQMKKAPSKQNIYNWIADSLDNLPVSIIIKSFLTTGNSYCSDQIVNYLKGLQSTHLDQKIFYVMS